MKPPVWYGHGLMLWGDGLDYDMNGETTSSEWLDAWHHLADTWDGSVMSFYMDGALLGSKTMSAFNTAVSVGNYGGGTYNSYPGRADNECDWHKCYFKGTAMGFRYFNLALSASDVALWMNMSMPDGF